MTIQEFIKTAVDIYGKLKADGITRDEFGKIAFYVRDLENSSQFRHFEYGVDAIEAIGNVIILQPGTLRKMSFAEIVNSIANIQHENKMSETAEIFVDGVRTCGFPKYDPIAKKIVLDYGEAEIDESDYEIGESILDTPRDSLDPVVWQNSPDGFKLTDYAKAKVAKVAKWGIRKLGITDPVIHIIGSITSNSYSDDSDIDIHFCSDQLKPDDIDQFNHDFRESFWKDFERFPDDTEIGTHPIEVFFQKNTFQDMTSVGCYDFLAEKWESGPELKEPGFDPTSEYYEEDEKLIRKLIGGIRETILAAYEIASAILRSSNIRFKSKRMEELREYLVRAEKLFQDMREVRKNFEEPTSKEEALRKRKDHSRHVADSAFKTLDKIGYMSILWTYSKLADGTSGITEDPDQYAKAVVQAVDDNLSHGDGTVRVEENEDTLPGMHGWNNAELKETVLTWLDERILDYELGITVKDIAFHGSRASGGYRSDSDLDVIVYYDGRDIKEDFVMTMLNEEPVCEIAGVRCDFWPVRDEESGNIEDVLSRNAEQMSDAKKETYRIWVDDIRQPPVGYVWLKSVNDFTDWYESKEKYDSTVWKRIDILDLDHDAGFYQKDGGDYIRILDWLEFKNVPELNVRLHSANPVGIRNMRGIIMKNGWTECYDILSETDIEKVDEGLKDVLKTGAAGLLTGISLFGGGSAEAAQRDVNTKKPAVTQQVQNASARPLKQSYRGLAAEKLKNLLATIIYNEAAVDYIKYKNEKEKCLAAIANVIDNRAGGDPDKYASVVSKHGQFYSYNHVKGGITDKTFVKYDPHSEGVMGSAEEEAWTVSKRLADQMLKGTVDDVVGNCNMIANEKLDSAQAWEKWGSSCSLVIGSHTFGYQPDQDGYLKSGKKPVRTQKTYVVQRGDTLWNIAKTNKTTVKKLKADNKLKSDRIKIGQVLKI